MMKKSTRRQLPRMVVIVQQEGIIFLLSGVLRMYPISLFLILPFSLLFTGFDNVPSEEIHEQFMRPSSRKTKRNDRILYSRPQK